MANVFRIVLALLLAFSSALCGAAVVKVPGPNPADTCKPENYPSVYAGDSNVTSSWYCESNKCGWAHTSPVYGWNPLKSEQCSKAPDILVCPANSSSDGNGGCVCATNYEEKNGQCVKKEIQCPAGQHLDGAVCVPDKCPDGQILSGGICVPDPEICPDGQKKVNGKCPEPKCKRGDTMGVTTSANMPTALCHNQCLYSIGAPPYATVCVPGTSAGAAYCTIQYESLGEACNGSDNPPTSPGTDPGTGPGTEPGTGPGTGPGTEPGTGPGTGPGGGGTNPGGGPPMPGTEPDTEGKCPTGTFKSGGKCYPNEEVKKPTDSAGNCPTGYTKKGDVCIGNKPLPDSDQGKDFCKENPSLDACKTGSFVGSCKANFKCEGDAVQCAIAREQHIRNCQMDALAETPEYSLYNNNRDMSPGGRKVTDGLQGNGEFTISVNGSDEFIGGGGGLTDQIIDLGKFGVLTLPLSQFNYWLSIMGNVFVIICSIVGAMTIIRRH